MLDSQSTRGSPQGGESGFDGAKKVKGCKRHMLVDTMGLLLAVSVTDRDGATDVVAQACAKLPSIKTLFVDGAYSGQCALALHEARGIDVQVARHPGHRGAYVFHGQYSDKPRAAVPTGFVVLPKRGVVERTHAWTERCRRLVMHHDCKLSTSTVWAGLAEAQLLVSRRAAQG